MACISYIRYSHFCHGDCSCILVLTAKYKKLNTGCLLSQPLQLTRRNHLRGASMLSNRWRQFSIDIHTLSSYSVGSSMVSWEFILRKQRRFVAFGGEIVLGSKEVISSRKSRPGTILYPAACYSANVQHYLRPNVSDFREEMDVSPCMLTHLRCIHGCVTSLPFSRLMDRLRVAVLNLSRLESLLPHCAVDPHLG